MQQKMTIAEALAQTSSDNTSQSLRKNLLSGIIRNFETLCYNTEKHTKFKPKDTPIKYLIIAALFQIKHLDKKSNSDLIYGAAESTKHINRSWAKGIVYGVLKKLEQQPLIPQTNLPQWLIKKIQSTLGEQALAQCISAWQQPPSCIHLRVNTQLHARVMANHTSTEKPNGDPLRKMAPRYTRSS